MKLTSNGAVPLTVPAVNSATGSAGEYHDSDLVVAKSDLQKTFDKDSRTLPARAMKKPNWTNSLVTVHGVYV